MSFQNAGIPSVSLAILPAAEVDALMSTLNRPQRLQPGAERPRIFTIMHSANDRAELIEPEAMWTTFRAVLALVEQLSPAVPGDVAGPGVR